MREKKHRILPLKIELASQLREDATFPEKLLWSKLRRKQVAGLKFRRQHVIGNYVVDFYCAKANLIIELDGRSHEGRKNYDNKRTEYLNSKGNRVVRYSNDDVLLNVDAVAEDIARYAGWKNEEELRSSKYDNRPNNDKTNPPPF